MKTNGEGLVGNDESWEISKDFYFYFWEEGYGVEKKIVILGRLRYPWGFFFLVCV